MYLKTYSYTVFYNRVQILVLFGYFGQYGDMVKEVQHNAGRIYIPLGKILLEARMDKGLSRAKLSQLSSVGENSIVRYEKAGIDEDGQWPPVDRLAKLCFHLDISPQQAVWAALPLKEFVEVEGRSIDDVMNHPEFCFLERQYHTLLKRNYFLGEALRVLLDMDEREEHEFPSDEVDHEWLKLKIREVIQHQAAFERRMLMLGIAAPMDHGRQSVPSYNDKAWYTEVSDPRELPINEAHFGSIPGFVEYSYRGLKGAVSEMEKRYPLLNKKSSEEDLPSPPSSSSKPTPIAKKEPDDEQPSE